MGPKIRRFITWVGFVGVLLAALATMPGQAYVTVVAQNPTPEPPISGAVATPVHRINIWAGPGRGFWVLGTATTVEAQPVYGVSPDKQFWQVKTKFGWGWFYYLDVTVTHPEVVPVADTSNVGAITAGLVAIRSGDGLGTPQIGTMSRGQQFFIIGQRPDGSWINIQWRFGKAWVKASLTTFTPQTGLGTAAANVAPVVNSGPRAIVNAGALNIRSGPGLGFTSLGSVKGGTVLPIIGRSEGGVWLQVQSQYGVGWVNTIYVITRDYFGSAPIAVATDAVTLATFRTLGGSAHVRSGPGLGFDVVFSVDAGMNLTIIGQSHNGWWYIDSQFGKGWINKDLGHASGAVSSVPFVQ